MSSRNRQRFVCLETGIIYKTLGSASKDLGISKEYISLNLRRKIKDAKGYHFEYYNPTWKDALRNDK